ncbi:MAG: flagellar export chaperone FliS [Desulfovibrionaceae bacterium]|nr:flagellar export chaperone FliS [Desulfovibrionaceae bacterium]
MYNAANMYLQTQVGTTGQGEIVVMLFDGALRFLAQARTKMLAKDYAGKGMLISRALDIVNELDSSLNMELGGELAKNLHQLYFLCTTRLLQANLKLDLEKLDSVVDILSGLREAFGQVITTAEAQAACAQLRARQNAHPTAMPRSVTTASTGSTFVPRNTAAGRYTQQETQHSAMAPVPPAPEARPAAHAAPTPPLAAAQSLTAPQAAPPKAEPAAVFEPAPKAAGFASKRLSLYGKSIQTR